MHFRQLKVWQKSTRLAVDLYAAMSQGRLSKDYGLRDQMQRASVSIASNIAEGYSRESEKDRCHFLVIAKGSCAELQTQLEIAKETGLLPAALALALDERCEEIARMLAGLIKSLRANSS
jgi:four helix bundle protein